MAIGLDAEMSGHGARARPDQNAYVKLAKLAQESPRAAVLEGWNDVSRMLRQVCDRHAIPCRGGTVEQLNALERRKLLDFHAYALLRDMNAFSVDTMASPSTDIALPVAQDYAVAVRGAQRLLHRLAAEAVSRPRP